MHNNENYSKLIKTYLLYTLTIVTTVGSLVSNLSAYSNIQEIILQTTQNSVEDNINTYSNSNLIKVEDESYLFVEETCQGHWVKLTNTEKIHLGFETTLTWNMDSKPSTLVETANKKNTVIIGHNFGVNHNYNIPTTPFAQIINTKLGQTGSACINGKYFEGKVIFSAPVDKYATHILGDWLGGDTVTLFTCYGGCNDIYCSEGPEERWVVAFEK